MIPASAWPARRFQLSPVGIVLKLLVSGGLLTLLLTRSDTSALWGRVRSMNPTWLVAALVLYGVTVLIGAWRWRVLLGVQHVSISTSTLSESFLVASFFNNFLPSNIGGDVVRVADTVPYIGSKTAATTVILVDRGLGLLALFLVAAGGAILARQSGLPVPGVEYLWLVFGTGVTVALIILVAPRRLARFLSPLRVFRPDWVDERLERLSCALERFKDRPSELIRAFGGALGVQIILVAFYLCIAQGLHAPLPLALGAVLVPVSLVAQMLPVSLNGFGVREAVFTYFFTQVGRSIDSALALSLVGAGLIMVLSVSGGALFLLRRRGGNPSPSAIRYET